MKYTDVFERNPGTGAVIIDIALDNYDDYYHEWDNAKYRMRDMHPDENGRDSLQQRLSLYQ